MTRPPLTIALSSVLAAAIDGADRPGLLATLHPEFGRPVSRPAKPVVPGMAQVITMPRVIPMPRRGPAGNRQPRRPDPRRTNPQQSGSGPSNPGTSDRESPGPESPDPTSAA